MLAVVDKAVSKALYNSIKVRKIAELFPHERTIPKRVEREGGELIFDSKEGVYFPIVVESSGVILDGMHRHAVAKKLGLGALIVQEVDYASQDVMLARWCRRFKNVNNGQVERVVRKYGMVKSDGETSGRRIRYGKAHFVFPTSMHIRRELEFLNEIERDLGITEDCYVGEDCPETNLDEFSLVIYPPLISKTEVVFTARAGRAYPPKSTRHKFLQRISIKDDEFQQDSLRDFNTTQQYLQYVKRHSQIEYLGDDSKLGKKYQIVVRRQ